MLCLVSMHAMRNETIISAGILGKSYLLVFFSFRIIINAKIIFNDLLFSTVGV